ncbi:membrane-spanning 4-domains subfamily A member 15 isoform X2 [Rhineura floridana]|uniref:membrane-spanning 4-domains subfamily A member 15 isoform X2 n=1 Tax=Rhineura floridana TaxID=261503 RepID=UPI002AC8761D|nr:membrane-spanning 4-domains subfamily A member 15 isoform X2 [Rhineura floridana]
MSATVTECGNVRIITQVNQHPGSQGAEAASVSGSTVTGSQLTSSYSKNTKNTLPKALGVVQIVVGTIQLSFGIALTVTEDDFQTLTVKSGVYFWIGILLLISGSLLVETEKRELEWLVKACFSANLLVSIAALVAIVLHGTEIAKVDETKDLCSHDIDYHDCSNHDQILSYGLNSVFIILSFLELSIAVTALVTGFKSTRQQLYRQMVL